MKNTIIDKSFSNATKSPLAFAGLLVDWKIGPKEITATLIDLIVRDFIGVSADTVFLTGQKTPQFKIRKLFTY